MRLLDYYKSTLISNAQGGALFSVFVKISVSYSNFSFALANIPTQTVLPTENRHIFFSIHVRCVCTYISLFRYLIGSKKKIDKISRQPFIKINLKKIKNGLNIYIISISIRGELSMVKRRCAISRQF